ncbi:MAG: GTPase HflX [Firmicutes bacterium]|nr:GTPase HflX [Bacillota bacterium]
MYKILGNTDGVRHTYIEQLESIYEMEMDRKKFCCIEILETIALFTEATGREAMVYLDRLGRVETVAVGLQDRVILPASRKRRSASRLSGIRCIHTHPQGNPALSQVDVQSLKSMRFDAMAAIAIYEGRPLSMQVGIIGDIISDDEVSINIFGPYSINSIPDDILWAEINAADIRIRPSESKKAQAEIARAILVGIEEKALGFEPLNELKQLADTAGFITAGYMMQPRIKPDKSYYLGYGKLQELILEICKLNADTVIFDDELSVAQIRNIQKELGQTEIIDRTSLILYIFSNRASTHEGRLQVELAQTKYLLPRMTGYWTHMSRMGGGGRGGTGARRGEGETQLEVDRRILRKRMNDLEKEIDKIKSQRDVRRAQRERSSIPIVALVGYTNAGKSTLMNHLTGSNVLTEDKLFATLDTVSRKLNYGNGEFLLVDTVGFIKKLPHDLINAFRATLEETKYADLLLHVIDAASENRNQQMEVVGELLAHLGVNNKPIIKVYNKCDISGEFYRERDSVAVSALTGVGMDKLQHAITEELSLMRSELSVLLPLSSGALVSYIYANGNVIDCNYLEDGIHLTAVLSLEDAKRVRASAIKEMPFNNKN